MPRSKIPQIAEGILARFTDLTLFLIAYNLEVKRPSLAGVEKGARAAEEFLTEVNYESIKRALRELRRQGLIRTLKKNVMEPEITAAGRRRLSLLLPQYQKRRPWDGAIYLVTYDIPITQNPERALFREFLRKIGCGLLQESIWVTPYNPTELVKEFVNDKNLAGTVLVSVLGKDGSIGGMTLEELIENVYSIAEVNEGYKSFLWECERREKQKGELVLTYLTVLSDDPQLPFELLPNWWLGDKAYLRFVRLVEK